MCLLVLSCSKPFRGPVLRRLVVPVGLESTFQCLCVVQRLVLTARHNLLPQIIHEGQTNAIVGVGRLGGIAVNLMDVHGQEIARADVDADAVLGEARVGPLVLVAAFNDDEIAQPLRPVARVLMGRRCGN